MKYRVELSATASGEADLAYLWLAERTSHANSWFNGLEQAIKGLAILPTRWPLARESREFKEPVRQMLYGKSPHAYRVLFVVRTNAVHVLHIRHGARQAMESTDIMFPPDDSTL